MCFPTNLTLFISCLPCREHEPQRQHAQMQSKDDFTACLAPLTSFSRLLVLIHSMLSKAC